MKGHVGRQHDEKGELGRLCKMKFGESVFERSRKVMREGI